MAVFDKILITGGGGMLAAALARSAQRRGHQPVLLGKAALDVANLDQVIETIRKHQPTLILNCAAYTKVDLCEQNLELAVKINGEGAANVAGAARVVKSAFVHFSTDFVFDGQGKSPYPANDPADPISAYGQSKRVGELAIQRVLGDAGLIIRTAWLYGSGGPNFVKTMIDMARANKPLRVVNDQTGSPTYTHDLAEATLDLVARGAHGIYHVTNSDQTTWFDFAKTIFEEFDLQPDLQPITSAEWQTLRPQSAKRPRYSVLDLAPLNQVLGRPMRSWREALTAFKSELASAP